MATKKAAAKKAAAKKAPAKKSAGRKAAPNKAPARKLSVTDQIKANNKALGAAVAAGDAKAVGRMYTGRARLMPPNADFFKGTKAITGFWQGALDMGIRGVNLKTVEVEQLGTTAIEVGTYTLAGGDGATLDKGKYIVVWKKDGGAWKLHKDIFNSSVAAAAPAPAKASPAA
jgi:ketosteroid isomerase-like protein